MIFNVDIEGRARQQFETIQAALDHCASTVYLGAVVKKMAKEKLEKAESFSYAYESKSVTISPDITARQMLQAIIPLAIDKGLTVIESEAGVQILVQDTGVHQYFNKWEPHANDQHFLDFIQTFKVSICFDDGSAYHRLPTGKLFQEYFGQELEVSLKVAALCVVYQWAVYTYPHLRKAS